MGKIYNMPSLFDRLAQDRLRRDISDWKLPLNDDRTSIVGKTGSGKTVFGVYLLLVSRLYQKMPWIIFDYKGDEFIRKIPVVNIDVRSKPPTDPGIYLAHMSPFDGEELFNSFVKKIWSNGSTGLFFDEAYMLPDRRGRTENSVLRAVFTTGRSRHIPIISLSQRPVDVLRYNFTEASHHVIFHMNDDRDFATVRSYIPSRAFEEAFGGKNRLPKYHCLWYDVNRDLSFEMLPCPDEKALEPMFDEVRDVKHWS